MKNTFAFILSLVATISAASEASQPHQQAISASLNTTLTSSGCANLASYGGVPDGKTDNSAAFNAAIAAEPQGNVCVYIPPGIWAFSAQLSYTQPTTNSSITIVGAGADVTQLLWSAGGGLLLNYNGAFDSVHIKDLSMLTGATGTGSAITLNQTQTSILNPANSALSNISNVTIRGVDGYAQTDYWNTGVNVIGVSNVNFTGDAFYGPQNATGGIGASISGTSALPPVVFNFTNCTFYSQYYGINYGNRVQGVTVSQSNFTGQVYGIIAGSGLSGLDQLAVTTSQFNDITADIILLSPIVGTLIQGNEFAVQNNGAGLQLLSYDMTNIVGNNFEGASPGLSGTTGIYMGTWGGLSTVITGNTFASLTSAIFLSSTSQYVNVQSNNYSNAPAPTTNAAQHNLVGTGSP